MPDLGRFTDFAKRVGAVAPACSTCSTAAPQRGATEFRKRYQGRSTCSTVAPTKVLQNFARDIKDVAPVAPVAPENIDTAHEVDLLDSYEERAAILEYDGGFSRHEAEALAWKEVFGDRERAA